VVKSTNLSIIIPTLNSPRTIKRAIESCLFIKNFCVEIIIVIDGLGRGMSNLHQEISSLPENFSLTVCEIERGGAAGARNFGLKKATGEWICFLDDDDELCAENIALALSFDSAGVDLIRGDFFEVRSENDQSQSMRCGSTSYQNSFELKFVEPVELFHEKGFWRYIYSRNFLNSKGIIFFPDRNTLDADYKHEDFFFLCHVLSSNPKTMFCQSNFYTYYVRPANESIKLIYLEHLLIDFRVCKLFVSKIAENSQFLNKRFLAHIILDRLYFAANTIFENSVEFSLGDLFSATVEVVNFYPRILPLACKRMTKQLLRRVFS
jgi:glycosyltransferase involved in cell wall biosynthesis